MNIEAGDKIIFNKVYDDCIYQNKVYLVDHVGNYGGIYYKDDKTDCKCIRCSEKLIPTYGENSYVTYGVDSKRIDYRMRVTHKLYVRIVEKKIVGERDNKINQLV